MILYEDILFAINLSNCQHLNVYLISSQVMNNVMDTTSTKPAPKMAQLSMYFIISLSFILHKSSLTTFKYLEDFLKFIY